MPQIAVPAWAGTALPIYAVLVGRASKRQARVARTCAYFILMGRVPASLHRGMGRRAAVFDHGCVVMTCVALAIPADRGHRGQCW